MPNHFSLFKILELEPDITTGHVQHFTRPLHIRVVPIDLKVSDDPVESKK